MSSVSWSREHLPPDRQAFIADARKALAWLYLAGLTLPAVAPGDDAVAGDSTNEWRVLYARLQEYLGETDPHTLEDPVPEAWRTTWLTRFEM